MHSIFKSASLGLASGDAIATFYTCVWIESNFMTAVDGFGIMAPETTQIAALQKNGGADARAIVQGMPFDIKDERLVTSHLGSPIIFVKLRGSD
jgi:hypothetical protein